MIVIILARSIRLTATCYVYHYSYAPSNVLIRHLQRSSCRGWVVPISAALAAVCYLALVVGLNAAVESGVPTWLSLIVFTCVWNTIRFAWLTVFSWVSTDRKGVVKVKSVSVCVSIVCGRLIKHKNINQSYEHMK